MKGYTEKQKQEILNFALKKVQDFSDYLAQNFDLKDTILYKPDGSAAMNFGDARQCATDWFIEATDAQP